MNDRDTQTTRLVKKQHTKPEFPVMCSFFELVSRNWLKKWKETARRNRFLHTEQSLKDANMPNFLWANTFAATVYLINRTMSSSPANTTLSPPFSGETPRPP